MLKKSLRIGKRDLNIFFKIKTRFAKGNLLTLKYAPNGPACRTGRTKSSRWTFVVSVKFKKGAAFRNLARRRMNAVAEEILAGVKPGYDLVFFMAVQKKRVPGFMELRDDMIDILKRSFLYV
ncbi:ribonuclease P protein component [Candidatus Giovannonibacteria bacterium]|nr:ribonuclease P protein component [Candidatus Giovannonibacteria bacterium]